MKSKIWTIIKNRYRLSTKVQMTFELGFPEFLIGQCRFCANNGYEIKTKKISLSQKGLVFSDTIPLSWFTSSVFIPWGKVQDIAVFDNAPSIDGITDTPVSSNSKQPPVEFGYCTLTLNDPGRITIDLPWSKSFTDHVQGNKLFEV